jgi:hypothetical protein
MNILFKYTKNDYIQNPLTFLFFSTQPISQPNIPVATHIPNIIALSPCV